MPMFLEWIDEILGINHELSAEEFGFGGNELAFLAANGKIEDQVRDKILFTLFKKYGHSHRIVKEYKDIDLAIFDMSNKDVPVCVVEFKACSDIETIGYLRYAEELQHDRDKLVEFMDPCERFFVMITNMPIKLFGGEIDIRDIQVYYKMVKRLFNEKNRLEALEKAEEKWKKNLESVQIPIGNSPLFTSNRIHGGKLPLFTGQSKQIAIDIHLAITKIPRYD